VVGADRRRTAKVVGVPPLLHIAMGAPSNPLTQGHRWLKRCRKRNKAEAKENGQWDTLEEKKAADVGAEYTLPTFCRWRTGSGAFTCA
jgi:hypothetical protein